MGIFSRRIVKRLLEENSRFLPNDKLNLHVNHLNGVSPIQRLTTEWEIAVLNGLHKLGVEPRFEPRFECGTSVPDVLVRYRNMEALIDITTASDRGLDGENPFRLLSDELIRKVRERGLDPNKFGLRVEGNWRQLHLGGPKPRLFIPQPAGFDSAVFDGQFVQFLDQVAASGRKASFRPCSDPNAALWITHDPAQQFFTGSHLDYTVTFTGNRNPVYNRLDAKASQLKKAGFNGAKGIVLCDAGCSLLSKNGRPGLDLGPNEVISGFLDSEAQIDFILLLRVKSDSSGLFGPEHLKIVCEMFVPSVKRYYLDPLIDRLQGLAQQLPSPENTPINAYGTEDEGKSFSGGGTMTGQKIKMSARAVLGVLSGRTKQEDFVRENEPFVKAFERMVVEGRRLADAKIGHVPERDDDWIEFDFSEADPAVGPFKRMGTE
jgi:hypothetical protein